MEIPRREEDVNGQWKLLGEHIQEFVIQYDKLLEHEDNNTSKFVECAQEERRSRMMDAVDDVMRAG